MCVNPRWIFSRHATDRTTFDLLVFSQMVCVHFNRILVSTLNPPAFLPISS